MQIEIRGCIISKKEPIDYLTAIYTIFVTIGKPALHFKISAASGYILTDILRNLLPRVLIRRKKYTLTVLQSIKMD
jgi:hypothetical protein